LGKTKILIVTPSLHIGGLEMVIAHICRYIDKKKFDIKICCLKELGSIGKDLINEGHSVAVLPKPRYMKNNYISWLQILRLAKKENIQILHSHTLDAMFDVALCRVFTRKMKVVHTFHFGNYPNLPKKYLYIEKFCSRFIDQLVAVGNEQKEKIRKALNLDDRLFDTVWNGVPKSQEKKETSLVEKYRKNEQIIIGTVCTLIKQKGLTYLLDVAYALKQKGIRALFLVAGEGYLRGDLEKKASRLNIAGDVVFMGWVDNASKAFIPYIDIFFLPSLWEAMSVVVLEAMEAGKPLVVTDVGENRHVIEDGVDGFVAEPGDIQGMVKMLERLIDNKRLREQVGKMAREKVRSRFSVQKMVNEYERLYEINLSRVSSIWNRF
jgi:glycosyltransferase involved in cell wall biosynthesis